MKMAAFNRGFNAYDKAVNQMEGQTEGASSRMSGVFKALGAGIAGFGVGAAASIAAVGGAALKLAIDAAPLQGVGDAFRGLGGDIEALREGSLGLATDAELMKSFNQAAALVSEDFAKRLPDAMQFLSKVSASTGEDMSFMINSLVKGVGRLSPMILDNLGIQVQLSEGTARAAEMFGVEAEELDKAQEQAGLMNVVLEKLQQNTASMPDITENAATKMGQLETQIQNTKDAIGIAMVPALSDLLDAIVPIVTEWGPKLVEWAGEFAGTIAKTLEQISDFRQWLDELAAAEEEDARVAKEATAVRLAANEALDEAVEKGGWFAKMLDKTRQNMGEYQKGFQQDVEWAEKLTAATEDTTQATAQFSDGMEHSFGVIAASGRFGDVNEQFKVFEQTAIETAEGIDIAFGRFPETASKVTQAVDLMAFGIQSFGPLSEESIASLGEMRAAWEATFNTEAVQEALGGIQSIMLDHANKMAAITETGTEKTREVDFSANLKRQIAQAEFNAKKLQSEAEFQQKRAVIEATGDQVALAQLENAHARETAQNEQTFAESQARSEFNEAVQQQIRERSQIIQQITQQKAFIAELETQKEFIRATLEIAVIKAEKAGEISAEEARTILRVVGTGQIEQLKNQKLFTEDATLLANKWASGQIGAAKSTVLAYEAVQNALDGQIDAAKIKLEELDQSLKDFEISLPPLKLPELPTLPELDLDIGKTATDAARIAGKQATESAERVVASTVSAMARAFEAAGQAIKDIVGFEVPEGFDQGLDNLGLAMVQMALKFNEMWTEFQTEIEATAAAAPGVKAMADAFASMAKAVNEIATEDAFEEGGFSITVDRYISRMKEVSGKIFAWMQEIDEETRKQVKLAAPVAKNVKELFSILGPDLSKIVPAKAGFESRVDLFFSQMRFVGVKIMSWLQDIDEQSQVALTAAVPVAENIGKLFGGIGSAISTVVDLAGLKDFQGVNMDVWKIVKSDIQALLTDISAWNLSVDDEAIDSVIGKLGKLAAVVSNLSDIVMGIEEMADIGGLDVSAARGILAQFNQLLAPGPAFTPLFPGLTAPLGEINPPAAPFTPTGGGAGSLGTINIVGKFEGPTGDFVTFVKEFVIGTVTDIILGDVGNPDYAV